MSALNVFRHAVQQSIATTPRNTICRACRVALTTRSTQTPTQTQSIQDQPRFFTTSTSYLKKSSLNTKSSRKSVSAPDSDNNSPVANNKHQRNLDSEADPYDHSDLQSAIDTAILRLKTALSKTRDAGRVSVQMIEELPVEINVKGGSAHKEQVRVREVATVVPKGGRMMQVFVSEEGQVKTVSAAIQASQHSLVPQPDQHNALVLNVPVPPATAETRAQAVAEAKKCFDKAAMDVRNARGDAQKRHKKMEQLKLVVPDELRKAHKSMEDVAKKGQDEVKRVYDAAVKALQNV